MKKTRIVGLLLVFVLVTSCFVGGTFAKYASQASGSDTAVVAKWEIIVDNANITTTDTIEFDLFTTIQDDDNPVVTGSDDSNVDNAANTDANTAQIIAPGTGGAFELVVENKSQVKAEYDLFLNITDTNIPLEFKIDNGEWTYNIAELNFVDTALNYANDSDDDTKTITIYWRWQFEQPHTDDNDLAPKDKIDTDLGIAPVEVTVTATVVATQVD